MHGYSNGLPLLNDLCNSYDLIFLEEHWLASDDLYNFNDVHNDFTSYGLSAMNNKLSSGIFRGRPFGGVAVLWRKTLSNAFKILDAYIDSCNGRFFSAQLLTTGCSIVFTCVYYPVFKNKSDYAIDSGFCNCTH